MVSLFDNIRNVLSGFGEGVIPAGGKIFQTKSTEFSGPPSDRYEDIEELLHDEKIYSIVSLLAGMVQHSYKGPQLLPMDRYTDNEITSDEALVLKLADDFCGDIIGIDYRTMFFEIAWDVILHGEERLIYKYGEGGVISGLETVALNSSYFVDDMAKIKQTDSTVFSDDILVVKKDANDSNPETYAEGEFEHVTYRKRGVWRKDIEGRQSFNTYSIVPGKAMQKIYKWKLKTMENDVIWKNKLMPRIMHTLDMAGFSPSKYPGLTPEAKTQAALNDAKKVINTFRNQTKINTPDEDLIKSSSVTTEILEANSTSYQSPNETLRDIDAGFNAGFGVPAGQVGGKSNSAISTEMDSVFESVRIEVVARAIARSLGNALRKQLILQEPRLIDVINRVYIHIDSLLPAHKHELARAMLAMAKSQVVLKSEMREMSGLPRIPQVAAEQFAMSKTGDMDDKAISQTGPGKGMTNEGDKAQRSTEEVDETVIK